MYLEHLLSTDSGTSPSFQKVYSIESTATTKATYIRHRLLRDSFCHDTLLFSPLHISRAVQQHHDKPTSLQMVFRKLHWLIIGCLLSTGLTSPIVADIEHGLISLTTHLNTTNLTVPYCVHAPHGFQPTLIDCTAAVNTFRFGPDAHDPKLWTARRALGFIARWGTCQVNLLPIHAHTEDTFALIDLANTASNIIAACRMGQTGFTLGGNDSVGQKAEFLVLVAWSYVEPIQTGNRG